jgi:hypothetical protein
MSFVLALTHQTGRRLAEIGFLLILFAGAIGGLLLIIATHSGHFG